MAILRPGLVSQAKRLVATGLLCLLTFIPFAPSKAQGLMALPKPAPKAEKLVVQTVPIVSFGGVGHKGRQFGKLEWLGGLELSSNAPLFGGFSGLAFLDAQHFLAVGDKGTMFAARLLIEDGRPVGLDQPTLRWLPGQSGQQHGWRRDAEGLTVVGNQAFVSFEGDTRIVRYSIENNQVSQVTGKLDLGREIREANNSNQGLEALTIAPDSSQHAGSFVIISEQSKRGRIPGWLLREGRRTTFTIPQSETLLITDAAFTAGGDLIVLERSFSLLGGLVIQLRRVRNGDFTLPDVSHTDILMRGTLAYELDNMEGLAVQDLPDGSSLITLISDDNFKSFQRTILLQFRLPVDK